MVATSYHKVLSPHAAQAVPAHPVEWWIDPNGQKWQRASLGEVAAGYLLLGVARSYGVDLLWRGRNKPQRRLFSDPLEELLQGCWERFSRKPGRHQVHRIAGRAGSGDLSTWWLASLGLLNPRLSRPYMIEQRLGGGAELFKLLPPAIARPTESRIRPETIFGAKAPPIRRSRAISHSRARGALRRPISR